MRATLLKRSLSLHLLLPLCAAALVGCADSTWEGARGEDTVAAYHRFLRDNPGSPHSSDAEERLLYLRARTHKTLETYDEFRRTYPESPLLAELREHVEELFFERAREQNTPEEYRAFLGDYPSGRFSARARGNLHYVEEVRGNVDAVRLQAFVSEHPASDFAPEAQRTLELITFRSESRISRLGVRVDVPANIDQPERVREGFRAVIGRRYRELGIDVEPLGSNDAVGPQLDAWMRVDYDEAPASGVLGGNTLFSHCRVRLYHKTLDDPIWDRNFEAPAEHLLKGAYGRDKTVFGNAKYAFWEKFFVPVATWGTSSARIHRHEFGEEVLDVDVRNDVAAVLFARGGVDFLDVSKPLEPERVGRYRRESDLSTWKGVFMVDDRHVAMFGPDGAEVVERNPHNVFRTGRWESPEVGRVHAAAAFNDETLLLAGSEGLFAVRLNQRPLTAHRLLDGELVGVEVVGNLVYLARPELLEVASAKHLLRHVTGSKVPLGENFGAARLRHVGKNLYLFGRDQLVKVSLATPTHPEIAQRLPYEQLGAVSDIAADASHLYLLGDRGLQIADGEGEWVSDFIQVKAGHAFELSGRYAFLVGERSLEIYDVGPYQAAANAAQSD